MEDEKPVLKNIVNDVEVTISFAEAEPARNAKEACLSIISRHYCEKITEAEGNIVGKQKVCALLNADPKMS